MILVLNRMREYWCQSGGEGYGSAGVEENLFLYLSPNRIRCLGWRSLVPSGRILTRIGSFRLHIHTSWSKTWVADLTWGRFKDLELGSLWGDRKEVSVSHKDADEMFQRRQMESLPPICEFLTSKNLQGGGDESARYASNALVRVDTIELPIYG